MLMPSSPAAPARLSTKRYSLLGTQISVLLLFMALSFISAFITLMIIAAPIFGKERLRRDIGLLAARYFPVAAIVLVIFTVLGVVWLSVRLRQMIYRPLGQLKNAASQIHSGNYSHELPIAHQGAFREVTLAFESMRLHLKATTQAAEQSERERRYLMANITHDLRTPVTSILGYAEGILDGVAASPEQLSQYAGIIRNKALALKALVDDLGLLSVLENAPPLQLERLDVGAWLNDFVSEQGYELNAELDCRCDRGLYCAVDRARLERVFVNLAANSIKYARPPGDTPLRLTFRAVCDENTALLTLTDNGSSIPPENMRRIFDRFYRADPSRGEVGGHGLGLSIAKQIVMLHNGKIWLSNRSTGGVTASVALPLMNPPISGLS